MAVSNSTDFSLSASGLVKEARAVIGIDATEEPLSDADLQSGLRALNMMLKAWQADGVMCWTKTEGSLTLVEGQESYSFASGGDFTTVPFDIVSARINRGSNDIPMFRLSRTEYFDLPNKDNEGYPTQYFYDRQRSSGTLYVWPAPDASAGTFKFTYRRIIMDLDDSADDIDLPQEWFEAIVYNLGKRFISRFGPIDPVTAGEVKEDAARSYAVVSNFDVADGESSISIMPDWDDR